MSPEVNFGSAHLLLGGMRPDEARRLLEAAVDAGARRLDTAPSYGHGASEALVGQVAGARRVPVTTKVGLQPLAQPARWRALAGRVLRALPATVVDAVQAGRGHGPEAAARAQAAGPSGRFAAAQVRASIERSLQRLGPLDRLLLHEVHPADIDDELLRLLSDCRQRGDVRTLGVATGNAVTAEALRRSHGLFTVAHVSVDPLGTPPPDPAGHRGVRWVGHGALGPAGRTLAHVRQRLKSQPALALRWADAVRATPFDGEQGVAHALLAHAASAGVAELVVATRRADRVERTVRAAASLYALPLGADLLLDQLLGAGQPAYAR